MTILFEEEGELQLPLECKSLAQKAIEAALDYAECPYEVEVNLLLTMDSEIQDMNCKFRAMDAPTDVLSFPMLEYDTPGEFATFEEAQDCFHPETGELILGDIVISKEKVLLQAEEYGHAVEREYVFLIVHSMLHLFGFDHMDDEERAVMESKQKDIMDILNILR